MRRKTLNISLGFVISILMTFSATQQVLAQCNWSTKVILPNNTCTNTVPGLTASGDRLILTWSSGIADTNGVFNSMISFDGVNWSNLVTRTDFPRIAWGYRGGLGMTYSPACGYVYAGWRDGSNNMWATRSVDGINWETPRLIASATALSAPTLRGDNGALPIGFSFSTYSSTHPGLFAPYKGKFNCDFSNPVFPIQPNFFNPDPDPRVPPVVSGQDEAIMPVWTGAGGKELSALATGPETVQSGPKYIWVQVNDIYPNILWIPGGNNAWSNNGVAGVINPNDGTPYIMWTCHPTTGDTCKPESTGKINIMKFTTVTPGLYTGEHRVCADWSRVNPAVTFFQGKIWIAWQGSGLGCGLINVASLGPF